MFCIIPDIIRDIILGIALVASATMSPPAIAPKKAAGRHILLWESLPSIFAFLLLLGCHFGQPTHT
jgi:hypothetical protein